MSSFRRKMGGFADTIRLANMPTVCAHVLAGCLATSILGNSSVVEPFAFIVALCSAVALYAAGNLLNDWWDCSWDRVHRPERALPSGLFHPATYCSLALALMAVVLVVGLYMSPAFAWLSLLVVLAIACYTWLHKRTLLAVIPMATCRAAVPWLGVFSIHLVWAEVETATGYSLLWYSGALFTHTAAISLSSRLLGSEFRYRGSLVLAWILAALPLGCVILAALQLPMVTLWQALACAIPYGWCQVQSFLGSMVFMPGKRVSWLLACFPMLDLAWLLPLILVVDPDTSIAWLSFPVLAFHIARYLQRYTSAD